MLWKLQLNDRLMKINKKQLKNKSYTENAWRREEVERWLAEVKETSRTK